MTEFSSDYEGRSDEGDPRLTAMLRTTYAAPSATEYWSGLEQRVLARLGDVRPLAWWSAFAEWRTVGMVAATLALLLSGAALVRHQAVKATPSFMANGLPLDSTYDAALQRALDGESVMFTASPRRRLPEDAPERYLNPLDW